jgi:hypothetical protein
MACQASSLLTKPSVTRSCLADVSSMRTSPTDNAKAAAMSGRSNAEEKDGCRNSTDCIVSSNALLFSYLVWSILGRHGFRYILFLDIVCSR